MQIKTTMRYLLTLTGITTFKKKRETQMTNVSEDVEKEDSLCTICGNVNYCSQCGKQYSSFLKKKKEKN